MKPRVWRALALLAVATTVLGPLSVPAVSRAGTFKAYFASGAGCGLFSASVSPYYTLTVCGSGGMQIYDGFANAPDGAEANISTTAPAGIAITGAETTYALSSAVGERGWGAGDFDAGGGEPWNPPAPDPLTDPPFSSAQWGFQLLCSDASGCSPFVNQGGVLTKDAPVVTVGAVYS